MSAGSKTVDPSSKMTGSTDSINDKEKINNLKSRIADMQAWQNYLEESLQKYESRENKREDSLHNFYRMDINQVFHAFLEENNLPSDIKTELINLLFEKDLEIRDLRSEDLSKEEIQKESEHIEQKYEELISKLLSDKYPAYKEFLKSQGERRSVVNFQDNMMTPDDRLEKEQEKRLIEAIYNERQAFEVIENEKRQNLSYEFLSNNEKIKMQGENLKILHRRYINSAKNILSESDLKKFQKYLDNIITNREMILNNAANNAQPRKENDQ